MDMKTLLAKIQSAQKDIEARKTMGINAIRPPAGETRWRILPGWRKTDRETFFHYYGRHWVKDADGKVVATYICESDTYGRPCVICDAVRDAIRATKDDKILEMLKEMTSRRGVLVNALQIAGPQADPSKPVLLDLPTTLFDLNLIPLFASRAGDDINMLDLNEGRDIIISKTGTGLSTRYSLTDAAKATKVDPIVLDRMIDIDAWLTAEKSRGDTKGVAPLNAQIHLRLSRGGVITTIGSLVPPAVTSAVLTANVLDSTDVLEIEQAVEAEIASVVKPAAKPAAKPATKPSVVLDDDLNKMLEELDAKS